MTLAIGTALQKGNYVVDAFCYEDSLGPTYLATQISTGQMVQVKILGTRPEQIPDLSLRAQLRDYLQAVSALKHPQIVAHLESFEEEGICYLVMTANVGQPLTHQISPKAPLSPERAIATVRQIHAVLESLRPLGWQGLVLTPDQIWQASQNPLLLLAGFDLPTAPPDAAIDEARLVPQLARLLYFLLTGEQVGTTSAPVVHLHHRCPGLHPGFETAITHGLVPPNGTANRLNLSTWMALLPEVATLSQVNSAQSIQQWPQPSPLTSVAPPKTLVQASQPTVIQPSSTQPVASYRPEPAPKRFKPQHGLFLTGLAAGAAGLVFGLALRLQVPISPRAASRLSPEQSFPSLPDWHGNDPVADFDTPYVSGGSAESSDRPQPKRHLPAVPEPIETPFRAAPPPLYTPPERARESASESAPPSSGIESTPPSESTPPTPESPSMADPTPPATAPVPDNDQPVPPAPLPPTAPAPPLNEAPKVNEPSPSSVRNPAPTTGTILPGSP